ncbi:DUF2934 domain-containing protein [Enterovirga aerilata]|uniref:DUF2934 domain-containing protein n=1 Tax=Enterovirga aerilata TaxID=2730920 RepID=A0A849IAQ9_9HYPH|nr:DUF2934 domain-containing protein [Enterovirga sp. DB1703]NNM74488.1 DUF2934 domain-containing protein [Enterovirga sp. DB1703]
MESERDRRVRERAHKLWEESGRPEGKADEHWAQACAEIDAESKDSGAKRGKAGKTADSAPKSKAKGATAPSGEDAAKKPAPKSAKTAASTKKEEPAPKASAKTAAGGSKAKKKA